MFPRISVYFTVWLCGASIPWPDLKLSWTSNKLHPVEARTSTFPPKTAHLQQLTVAVNERMRSHTHINCTDVNSYGLEQETGQIKGAHFLSTFTRFHLYVVTKTVFSITVSPSLTLHLQQETKHTLSDRLLIIAVHSAYFISHKSMLNQKSIMLFALYYISFFSHYVFFLCLWIRRRKTLLVFCL